MQVHPWFICLAVIVAAAAFSVALMVPVDSRGPYYAMHPPLHTARR